MDLADQELVERSRVGSDDAFEQLVRRYERLVYRIAYGFLADHDGALEVVQETFLRVHARLPSWRGEGELRNWIARIAANQALNRARAARRRPTCDLDEDAFSRPDLSQEVALAAREARDALRRSLESLNPRQRLALILRYFQEMSPVEIAGVLECSEGTARNLLSRSLQRLRSAMARPEEAVR